MSKTTKVLTIFFFPIAVAIILQGVFHASPITIGKYLIAQIGSSVGITISVPSNPFNTLAQQLKEKESALSEKERELEQKKAVIEEQINKEQNSKNKTLIYLLGVGGILLVLILANFYFDWRRRRNSI